MAKHRNDRGSNLPRLKRAAHQCRAIKKGHGQGYRVRIRNALRL